MIAALVAVSASVRVSATVPNGDIVIVAVDSSRVPDPDGPDARVPVAYPIRDSVAEVVGEINRLGGLLGRRLKVVSDNDQCEAEEAAAVAGRAVALGAAVVIGHACSGAAIRAAAVYADAGLLMIATGPRHPRLTSPAGRRGIYRLAGRDDRQAESIAALLASKFAGSRAAVVHDQSLQGRGMAEEIRRSAAAGDVPVALLASYRSGTKDHAALIQELVAAKIDLVIFPGQMLEASIILDQARDAGHRIATAIGTDVLAAEEPPTRLLAATTEFLVMLQWPGVQSGSGSGGPAQAGLAIDSRLAVAAAEVWAQAVAHAQSIAPDAVAAALRRPAWPTVVGPLHFDERGDAVVPSFLPHVWRDGRWQLR